LGVMNLLATRFAWSPDPIVGRRGERPAFAFRGYSRQTSTPTHATRLD